MMSGVDFAVLCVSDSLQKSKTPVVEGRNFNFGLPVASRRLSQFEFPLATAQFLHQCLLTDISNAISRIQSCKYENSGCWEKIHFAYVSWMRNYAAMRYTMLSCQNPVLMIRRSKSTPFFFFCKYLKLWLF